MNIGIRLVQANANYMWTYGSEGETFDIPRHTACLQSYAQMGSSKRDNHFQKEYEK
jgi:hypothetical protein